MFDSVHDIIEKYNAGGYEPEVVNVPDVLPDDFIIDENMTVKWNKEQVQQRNKSAKEAMIENKNRQRQALDSIKKDIIGLLTRIYGLNVEQATYIECMAYEDKHSCTTDYIYESDRLAKLVCEVNKLV